MGVSNCSMFCCSLLYFHSSFCNHLDGEERAGCFAFIFAFLVPCDCCVALPYGAMGVSTVVIVVLPVDTHLLFLS